jgi:hypothetical protein
MKDLRFTVRVEELPDHTKDYRVSGAICVQLTSILRETYGAQVNVIVQSPHRAAASRAREDGGDMTHRRD